jgi:hypothetical protein
MTLEITISLATMYRKHVQVEIRLKMYPELLSFVQLLGKRLSLSWRAQIWLMASWFNYFKSLSPVSSMCVMAYTRIQFSVIYMAKPREAWYETA